MTWEASDGRSEKKFCSSKRRGKEKRGRGRETEKLYKKWQELMLMDLYKYYFQHMEKAS